jgi:hypothetical protein
MTTAAAPTLKPDHAEDDGRPTLAPVLSGTTPRESDPYDDPTQGRKLGSDPYDDPTQGRKLGSEPYDDPTRGR